ncbi:MAG: NAD(P)-dependent oxidoreductase, partial [Gemmatimonadota bacterium]
MRVLITGAAGAVGSCLVSRLQARHALRGFDLSPMPGLRDVVIGDVADLEVVEGAMAGMEAVIHLGGFGGDRPWEEILPTNYVGTYNVFEAARRQGVRRIAFASRAGLLSSYPKSLTRTVDLLPLPNGLYDISKIFGESLGYMYAARFGLEVVAVRIGNCSRDRDLPLHPHHLSPGDCARVFEAAITRPGIGYEVVFAVSDSNWPMYDLEHGRQVLGYRPQ